jgi:hypothetical protein
MRDRTTAYLDLINGGGMLLGYVSIPPDLLSLFENLFISEKQIIMICSVYMVLTFHTQEKYM